MADAESARLELIAEPGAVSLARAWLTARLPDWSADGIATVQLLVSELVTNAILHTADVVEVSAERSGAALTVEVADRNPSKPVVKRYGQDAATGRGLRLVEALAEAWGVRRDDHRKAVWFRVVDGAPQHSPAEAAMNQAGSDGAWSRDQSTAGGRPEQSRGSDLVVRLGGLPVATYLEVEEHHDALVREFTLLLPPPGEPPDPRVPPRLLVLAAAILAQFGVGNEQRREQVDAARRAGLPTVDVTMRFPLGAEDQVRSTAGQLDEADGFCARGELLTPPSSKAVTQFRHWYTDEVVRQLSGHEPARWPYPIDAAQAPLGYRP